MKHQIGDVWKDNFDSKHPWSVQFEKFIEGFKTKKEAIKWAELAKNNCRGAK